MAQVLGITDLLAKKYELYDLGEFYKQHLGEPEKGFTMSISGFSANGKTNYTIMVTKAFAAVGIRVDYNSFEEGHGSSLQIAAKRHNMQDVNGKVMWLNRFTLDELVERLQRRGSSNVVVLDSGDDMELTYKNFLKLKALFPKKSFIIVLKGDKKTGEPIWTESKKIKFKTDIKVVVKDFVAYPDSRYGGNANLVIRNKQAEAGQQQTLSL